MTVYVGNDLLFGLSNDQKDSKICRYLYYLFFVELRKVSLRNDTEFSNSKSLSAIGEFRNWKHFNE